jgi:hypothetical protein
MCQARILRRLRFTASSNNWKMPRQSLKEVLEEAISSLGHTENKKLQELHPVAKLFTERAKEVIKLADSWAKHQKTARLRALVEGVSRLRRIRDLQALLDSIPDRAMDPSSRCSLLNIVSKVARYREVARFLYRTAKKFPLVQHMKVVLVDLPPDAFHRVPVQQHSPTTLPSTLSRIDTRHGQWDIGHICRLLNTTEADASRNFAQQATRKLKETKIHAEIQLLLHSELHPSELPPRVVRSSKDACFLCNLFIKTHAKMYTSRSHGRIYPGWRLPPIPKSDEMEQRFSQELEDYIRDSLETLRLRKEKTVYPYPNESTLSTLQMTESTLSASAMIEAATCKEDVGYPALEDDLSISTGARDNSPARTTTINECLQNTPRIQRSNVTLQPTAPIPSTPLESSETTFDDDGEIIPGQTLSKRIKANRKSNFYRAGGLEIIFTYSAEPSQNMLTSGSRKLPFSVEWLAIEEAEKVKEHQQTLIVDAETLDGEISLEENVLNCYYIAGRGSVLKILLPPAIA